jgi:hypothetical protein
VESVYQIGGNSLPFRWKVFTKLVETPYLLGGKVLLSFSFSANYHLLYSNILSY